MDRVEYYLGGNYIRRNFLDCSNPGGNFPGGSYRGWEFSGWELSGWELSWVGIFFGGGFLGGNSPGGIIRVAIFWVGVSMLPFSWKIYELFRGSHQRCFMKKAVLKKFSILTGKLQTWNFIKNRLQQRSFPLNIAKFLRTSFLNNIC